jgi:hypothetical protein
MLVDLLGISVLSQETTKDTHAANPDNLGRKSGFAGTSSLTGSSVTSLALSSLGATYTSSGVDSLGLADNETILHQLANILA